MMTIAKARTALNTERCPATNRAILSTLYPLGVNCQLLIWSVLNNRFDVLVAPALTLFKVALHRLTEKTRRNKRC